MKQNELLKERGKKPKYTESLIIKKKMKSQIALSYNDILKNLNSNIEKNPIPEITHKNFEEMKEKERLNLVIGFMKGNKDKISITKNKFEGLSMQQKRVLAAQII